MRGTHLVTGHSSARCLRFSPYNTPPTHPPTHTHTYPPPKKHPLTHPHPISHEHTGREWQCQASHYCM